MVLFYASFSISLELDFSIFIPSFIIFEDFSTLQCSLMYGCNIDFSPKQQVLTDFPCTMCVFKRYIVSQFIVCKPCSAMFMYSQIRLPSLDNYPPFKTSEVATVDCLYNALLLVETIQPS